MSIEPKHPSGEVSDQEMDAVIGGCDCDCHKPKRKVGMDCPWCATFVWTTAEELLTSIVVCPCCGFKLSDSSLSSKLAEVQALVESRLPK